MSLSPLPERHTRPGRTLSHHATIELNQLLRQYELELVLITGTKSPLPVQGVHSSDIPDPAIFLTPRTVLLTNGTQFDDEVSPDVADDYISRLARAGVTALGFGLGIKWQHIPQHLITAAERHELALFRVPYHTSFLAIAQTAVRLLNAQVHARDAWALESQRAVASAATHRDGLSAVVREAANRLDRWVAITDRVGRIVEFSPRRSRAEISADWIRRETRTLVERGVRSSRVSEFAGESFQLQTLGRNGSLLGALITPSGVDDPAERMLLGLVAAIATVQFEHRAGRRESETALRSAVINLLLAGELALAERVAAGVLPRLPGGRVYVVRLNAIERLSESLVDDLRSLAGTPGLLTAPFDGGAVLVCESSQIGSVRRVLAGHATPAGVSERGGVDALEELLDQAGTALEHAESVEPRGPQDYRPEMHGGMLRLLDARPEARRLAASLLAPVRTHDRKHGEEIERSLAVWLRHHGQTSPAATELGVHRHTLRARIRTAASLLHRDLDDIDARTELWAALRYSA